MSVGGRIVKLLSSLKAESPIALMGGLSINVGMIEAIKELMSESKHEFEVVTHPDAIYSGAIGAAVWGGFRHNKLKQKEQMQTC